jgi:hypothetical protein
MRYYGAECLASRSGYVIARRRTPFSSGLGEHRAGLGVLDITKISCFYVKRIAISVVHLEV